METCLIALAATLCGAESCVDAPRSHCCGGLPRGLVNSREHLESLLVAKETGYASLQQYLGVMADDPERRADAVATAEAR